MFVLPQPTKKEILDYYSYDYVGFNSGIDEEANSLIRYARLQKMVKKCKLIIKFTKKKTGDILDVGCGMGHFLYVMNKFGWNGYGIEPSIDASNYARDHYHIHVENGTSQDINFNSQMFDVVTYWDVLEHTYSPSKEISLVHQLIKPGGFLFINIPNWDSFDRHLFNNFWIGFNPPEHLYIFMKNNISQLLKNTGFRLIDWVCVTTSYFAFAIEINRWLSTINTNLANKVKSILEIPGMRYLFEPILTPINWLGLGSTITIIAQKTNTYEK